MEKLEDLRYVNFCLFVSLDINLDVCDVLDIVFVPAFINDDPMTEDVNADNDDELCFVLVKLRPIPDDDVCRGAVGFGTFADILLPSSLLLLLLLFVFGRFCVNRSLQPTPPTSSLPTFLLLEYGLFVWTERSLGRLLLIIAYFSFSLLLWNFALVFLLFIFSSLSNIASSRFDVAVCGRFDATIDDDDVEFLREMLLRRDEARCFRGMSEG